MVVFRMAIVQVQLPVRVLMLLCCCLHVTISIAIIVGSSYGCSCCCCCGVPGALGGKDVMVTKKLIENVSMLLIKDCKKANATS